MDEDVVSAGSTNVFVDLEYPDAGLRQTKTRLAMALVGLIKAQKLKQTEAAKRLGIPQPKVSALMNYRLDGFSVEKLMALLTALDQDVEIMIRPRAQAGHGQIAVHSVR